MLEISPGWSKAWRWIPNYTFVDFPEFDVCKDRLDRKFDTIIADQVLEHVPDPAAAVVNIREMLKPDGVALIATPFLFRIHARPHDYHRWTEAGLKLLLQNAGFSSVETKSWGNPAVVRAHLSGPVKDYGFGRDLSNDPEYPIIVWAYARP